MWNEKFRQILIAEFERRKRRNPRISLRAFAKAAGASAGTISEILNDRPRWSVSQERALEMVEALNVQTDHLKALMGLNPTKEKIRIEAENFDTLTDWKYYPVLMAFDLDESRREPATIAQRLGISTGEVEHIIADLLRRGLLERTEDARIQRKKTYWDSGPELPTSIIRQHHRENIKLSLRALDEIPAPEREISSLTFVGNKEQFELLRQEIIAFQDRLISLMQPEASDEVYRMSVQLFPVNFAPRSEAT